MDLLYKRVIFKRGNGGRAYEKTEGLPFKNEKCDIISCKPNDNWMIEKIIC